MLFEPRFKKVSPVKCEIFLIYAILFLSELDKIYVGLDF